MSIAFQAKMSGMPGRVWQGEILPIQLKQDPYEIEVTARGSSFHLIVGHHAYGNYKCIPNWDIGTELSSLSDHFWNLQQLCNAKLNEVDACSVAYALFELSKYVDI